MKSFETLPLGAVQPRGWLLAQLQRDLERGFAGRLDQLTPNAAHDLFRERIASSDSFLAWWDAETRGNWLWGYVMMASLAHLPEHRARTTRLVADLLDTQDADGYIGIYGPTERYRHAPGENGELWAQSRALLPLIACYEAYGGEHILGAIRRAVDRSLRAYSDDVPYFTRGAKLGRDQITGLTHGLCYLDVLEWLHDKTGDAAYAAAGVRFYREFSSMPVPFPNDDLALPNLLEARRHFTGHAVHTAEHLRALLWAHSLAPELVSSEAVAAAFQRMRLYRLPSGALLGDENIHGMPHPESPYEFCTAAELSFSLTKAVQRLASAEFADWLETLVFNAVQGSRLPDGSAIAYLSADTRLLATADRPDAHSHGAAGRRFKYSPTHDDVACCCNPNADRLLPQFISHMWLRLADDEGFVTVAYGPCELRNRIGDTAVTIVQETGYPFEDRVTLTVAPEQPLEFTLVLRQPGWAGSMRVLVDGSNMTAESGWYHIRKTWQRGDRIEIDFSWQVRAEPYANGEVAVLRGPLQFVLPVDARMNVIRNYPATALHDYDVEPVNVQQGYHVPVITPKQPDLGLALQRRDGDAARPWDSSPYVLRGADAELVPMGCTVLRRAAFPLQRAN